MSCCKNIVIYIKLPDCYSEDNDCDKGNNGNQGPPQPIPTPFLVIPCLAGDQGARPVPVTNPGDPEFGIPTIANQSIVANIVGGADWADFQLQLSCVIGNLGAVASPAAMVEFYTGTAIWWSSAGHDTLTPAQVQANVQLVGRVSATIPPGSAATVNCPNYWVPGSEEAAQQGVLVQVRDLFTDPITAPFDAINDRHVARFDAVMDPIIN
jgi:hypothetical protein